MQKTFSSLSIRNYRLYFIAQAISLSGTWMQIIGQAWLVLRLTNSGTVLGLVTALQFLPILIFGPWGGVIADRFPKRKILYFTQSASGILALILGILVATNLVQLWMVYVLAAALGFVTVIDNPTRQTFVFEMVGKDALTNAVTLNSTEANLARVIGPSIAGVIIATIGLAPCFLINALSYTAILVVLFMMDARKLYPSERVSKVKGQLREGFTYVASTPILFHTLIMMAIVGTLTYEFSVILPLVARFTYHGNAGTFALLSSSLGIGSVIGGLFAARRKKVTVRAFIVVAFLFGLSMVLSAIMSTLLLEVIALVIVGVFSINFISLGNTILQLESAPTMRGRVMALWAVAFLGSTPIGGPIIGWIGEYASPRWGLAVGGFAAIAAAGYGLSIIKLGQRRQQEISEEIDVENADVMSQTTIRI